MHNPKDKEEKNDSNVNVTVNLQGVSTAPQESRQFRAFTKEDAIKFFDEDLAISEAIGDRVRERISKGVREKITFAEAAQNAFKNFDPSRYPKELREEDPTYLAPKGDIRATIENVFSGDINRLNQQDIKNGLSIDLNSLTQQERKTIQIADLEEGNMKVNLVRMMELVQDRMPEGNLVPADWFKLCQSKAIADRFLEEALILEEANDEHPDINDNEEAEANNFVKAVAQKEIRKQLRYVTSPEEEVIFGVKKENTWDFTQNKRQSTKSLNPEVKAFSLRPGPADVTAFHDFYDLQIAFRHIWTELLDSNLKKTGISLYEELVKLKGEAGIKDEKSISTYEEYQQLVEEYNQLRITITDSDQRLGDIQTYFPRCTKEIWLAMDHSMQNALFTNYLNAREFFEDTVQHSYNPQLYDREVTNALAIIINTEQKIAKAKNGDNRVGKMLLDLENRMADIKDNELNYAFDIFAPDSYNFGILVNYRQRWEPKDYQVGDLVSSIPLAPKEVRRFSKKKIVKKSRSQKEMENSLQIKKTDISDTSRTHAEIVQRADNKTSFQHTASGGVNMGVWNVKGSHTLAIDASKHSQQTKKAFREAILKVAEEYKNEHRLEISTTTSEDYEESSSGEISNPNDEITVTYLFYELQRRYEISEKIHKITPVILVANDVPNPSEIDEEWLTAHDWILRKVILDDSYLSGLNYLSQKFIGDEISVDILRNHWLTQQDVVNKVTQQIKSGGQILEEVRKAVDKAVESYAQTQVQEDSGFFNSIGNFLFGGEAETDEAMRIRMEAAKEALQRVERENQELRGRLASELSVLERVTNQYSQAVEEQFNRRTEILRLRAHVKDNILYYMQAIWDHEPPDQRFFRLYNKKVLNLSLQPAFEAFINFKPNTSKPNLPGQNENIYTAIAFFPPWDHTDKQEKELVEIADLDNLLGYKGNYMIFPLKKSNDLTTYMMQDYIDLQEVAYLWDPDELGNYSPEELKKLVRCLNDAGKLNNENREKFRDLLVKMYSNPYRPTEEVIVPTDCLYIEVLPGTHPILENFKLAHRAIDVKKVQAEVRHDELENIRLTVRVLKGDYEDPDIDKKIKVEGLVKDIELGID